MLPNVNLRKEIRQKGTPIRRRERNVKETMKLTLGEKNYKEKRAKTVDWVSDSCTRWGRQSGQGSTLDQGIQKD